MAEFTKNDLKSGMIVTLKNGNEGIVFLDAYDRYGCKNKDSVIAFSNGTWVGLKNFHENLESDYHKEHDIVKVEGVNVYNLGNFKAPRHLIWEREEVKELTIADVEKLVGGKVKIVKEKTENSKNNRPRIDELLGKVIETRNRTRYIILNANGYLIGSREHGYINLDYNDELIDRNCPLYDIMKVYHPETHLGDNFKEMPKENLIWERKEYKEITIAEIEELVGCKVKIVKEKSCKEDDDLDWLNDL